MGPELLRFYGGTPQQWEATPWAVARRYFEAIPRVRRRESGETPAPARMAAPPPQEPRKRQPTVAELRQRLPEFGIGMGA